jgi:hypothetical protein
MSIDPFIVSAFVVAMVIIVTIIMLVHLSKPEKRQDESKDKLETVDQKAG